MIQTQIAERTTAVLEGDEEEVTTCLERALESLGGAATGFTGEERTKLLLAMSLVSSVLGDGQIEDDHRHNVEQAAESILAVSGR
jgi:hypothetical protein